MKQINTFFLFSLTVLFLSCSNDSESDLTDIPNGEPVTYSGTVKNIIDTNCISCHGTVQSNGAPMSLTTYENVKSAVLTRGLLDRISRTQGSPGMMPNGGTRLPQNIIDQVVEWNNDGLLE